MKTLVISASGLNLAYVGAYGGDWSATPNLDELAARSVLFDQHYCDQPDAVGSGRAWRSGRYQFPTTTEQHKGHQDVDLIAALSQDDVVSSFVGPARSPLHQNGGSPWRFIEIVSREKGKRAFEETLGGVRKMLRRLARKERWLAWVVLPTLLPPWKIPAAFLERYFESDAEEVAEDEEAGEESPQPLEPLLEPDLGDFDPADDHTFARIQHTYAAGVRHLDEAIGGILAELHERGGDEVSLIFTADHGLPLGEHAVIGLARPWLYEELVHAPLILRLPGNAEAGRRVSALTQPVDLQPTIADLHGVQIPLVHGQSVLRLARGDAEETRSYACSGLRVDEAIEWSLRTPHWSYLLPVEKPKSDERQTAQLYVKPDDRWEVNNVIQHHHELAEHLEQILRGFVENSAKEGSLQAPVLRDVEAVLQSQVESSQDVPQGS
jgi:arylsulfatase A-like enzyme